MTKITAAELKHLIHFGQSLHENGNWYSDALGRHMLQGVRHCIIEKETQSLK